MNTANLELTGDHAFKRQTQETYPQPQTKHHQPRTRKKVRVSLRKKDTSLREKRIWLAIIFLILALFVGALGITFYSMATGNAPEASAVGYLQP